MRHYKSYITMALAACTLSFASCSDEYMENMNTDPSKAATIDPNAQLTTAQLHTYGDLEVSETYRSYIYAFNQQLMGCWNTTNYGGRHTLDLNEMGHIWQNYYLKNIKDLTDAQARTTDDDEKVNSFYGETMSTWNRYNQYLAGYKFRNNMRLSVGIQDPFGEFSTSVTRNYSALAGSTKTMHYPNLKHCLLVSFSWNLNFGKQYKALQKKIENSDSESGILK